MKCENCKGSGTVLIFDDELDPFMKRMDDCPECGGEGEIEFIDDYDFCPSRYE